MAVSSAQVSVGTTATALTPAVQTADYQPGSSVTVLNPATAAQSVYLGAANVTVSNGFLLAAGVAQSVDLQSGERLYAVVASGTQTIHTLQTGI